MDTLLSKRNSVRKRASFSLRFGLQKPTFAVSLGEPTRYYDFVDTPVLYKPPSPLIDRREIESELESKIRYSCALLVYRIEQGIVPSSSHQPRPDISRQGSPAGDTSTKAQLESKYMSPKVGPEAAALKSKYDSGVGLTQQPSMQTMRVLNSRSGEPSESDDCTSESDVGEKRTNTSCSSTTTTTRSTNTTESSRLTSSAQSPKQSRIQSIAGRKFVESDQLQDHDTLAFLKSSSNTQNTNIDDHASEDIEVFLNPDAKVDSNGLPTFSPLPQTKNASPSLGISREPISNRQSGVQDEPTERAQSAETPALVGLGASGVEEHDKNPSGVIIDGNGRVHILTAAEEAQRAMDLQQAVMAKMKANIVPHSGSKPSGHKDQPNLGKDNPRPQSNSSRIKSSWASSKATKSTAMKQKLQPQEVSTHIQPTNTAGQSVFKKMANFFFAERT